MQYVDINCKPSPESCLIFLSPYHHDSDLETMESFNREYWKITIGTFLSIHHSNSLVDFDHPEFDYDRFDQMEGEMLLNGKEISQDYYEDIRKFTKIFQNSLKNSIGMGFEVKPREYIRLEITDSKIEIIELRNNEILLETTDFLSGFIVKDKIKYLGLSNGNNASGMYYVRGHPITLKWGLSNANLSCGPIVQADCPTHRPCCSSQGFIDQII